MTTTVKRRRFTPAVIATGALGSLVMALSMNGTLAAFAAKIDNTNNFASVKAISLEEQNEAGSDTSNNCKATTSGAAAQCDTINKFGAAQFTPGAGNTKTTSIQMRNTGSVPISAFKLWADACKVGTVNDNNTPADVTDDTFAAASTQPANLAATLCGKMNVKVETQTVTGTTGSAAPTGGTWASVHDGPATGLPTTDAAAIALGAIPAGSTMWVKFTTSVADADLSDLQGQAAGQVLHWEASA